MRIIQSALLSSITRWNTCIVHTFLILSMMLVQCCCISPQQRENLDNATFDRIQAYLPIRFLESERKLSDHLLRELGESPSEKKFKVLIDFKEQLNLSSFCSSLKGKTKKERRGAVIDALKSVSEAKATEIISLIDSLKENGNIEYSKKLSIVNRLYVVADAQAIMALSSRPDVARVIEEYSSAPGKTGKQFDRNSDITLQRGTIGDNWALRSMGADIAWKNGFDGSGVVVGSLDTGVWLEHEQLKGNFRAGDNSWFDPVSNSSLPSDSKGHGTGVLSCAVGMNPGKNKIGIAPAAQWIAALSNHKNYYNNIFMSLCADWMLNVGRPDIIVNAWSHGSAQCDSFDLDFINAWKAAEIFPVFAAGNKGPRERSSESPADLSSVSPVESPVFSIGAVNSAMTVSHFSSRGPSMCTGNLFPMAVAPGEDVFFAFPIQADSYIAYSGTSSATGYAAGAIALLIQKFPEMSVVEIELILKKGALDLGEKGPDNESGYGFLYLPYLLELKQ